jgi:A/G-specific adenine glycosylase
VPSLTVASRPAAPQPDAPHAELVERVAAWFDDAARDLPWRRPERTPWGVLVSEVMLQQTPVVRVEPAWRAWLERWPTPADLAAAPTAAVLRAWDRLGYPRRALRLQECARAVVERHGGRVPDDEGALRALPGVGEYTAAAVRAFAFGRRSVVVDTNVRRVLARAVTGTALPAPSPTAAERAVAAAVVPAADADAARWAAASMELGALVCTARAPRCPACPVADLCAWRAAGSPPDAHAGRRRTQSWHGTDRQCRGRIMAVLREAAAPADRAVLDAALAATASLASGRASRAAGRPDASQVTRCLAGLVEDGLVEQDAAGAYHLPRD